MWGEYMNILKKIIIFFEKKSDYWYIVLSCFVILDIINNAFLELFVPRWGCSIVTIILIIFLNLYIGIMYRSYKSKYKNYTKGIENKIIFRVEELEEHICDINEKQIELENKLTNSIKENIEDNTIKINNNVKDATNTIIESVSSTRNELVSNGEVNITQLVEKINKQYSEQIKFNVKNFTNINSQLFKQNEFYSKTMKEQNQGIKDATTIIGNAIEASDILTKQESNNIESKLDKIKGIIEITKDNLNGDIQKLSESIRNDVKIIHEQNDNNTKNIIQQVESDSQNTKESYVSLNEKINELNNFISNVDKGIGNKLEQSVSQLEDIYINESTINKDNTEKLINKLEENLTKKVDENVLIEKQILESINDENELIEAINNSVRLLEGVINKNDQELKSNLRENKEFISKQINTSIEKMDILDSNNIKRLEGLTNRITQIEQNIISKTDILGVRTADLQAIVTKLITQVLDEIDDLNENENSSYDRIFKQISGFSNSIKRSLNKIIQELNDQKQTIENETKLYLSSINEQFEQDSKIKNEISEGLKINQNYQEELRSRFDNLQSQISVLSSLSEMVKNISTELAKRPKDQDNIKPNRVEKIEDKETGIIVHNHYKNNKLILSEMMRNNKKVYDAEYDSSGQIIRTRNYGDNGDVITELQFYENGQVKTRKENINVDGISKEIISNFDKKGNKM